MSLAPIEFWFDFSSGYAYFAAFEIDALGERHARTVLWRPYMLGVAFKHTGARGLSSTPMKGDYARHDWARLARSTGHPFAPPANHPIVALPASRAYYWIEENAAQIAHEFGRRVFHAYFAEAQDLSLPANVAAIGAALGVDAEALEAAMTSDVAKTKVKTRTAEAIDKGVFGSPFFLVDDEPFWGGDRLPMLDAWLASSAH